LEPSKIRVQPPSVQRLHNKITPLRYSFHICNVLSFEADYPFVSEEPFTIFAPRNNEASLKDAQSLLAQPDLVKKLLLDHIVLGLKLNLNLTGDFTITTLGGRTVHVRRVNGK
jgi:Secreted and surface protein containing fasciclin-like repeats